MGKSKEPIRLRQRKTASGNITLYLDTALIKNDILDNKAGEISFQDPIYAYWLKTEFFAK